MRVVVDASVVAAVLVQPRGWTARELGRTDVEWVAPQFLRDELEENAGKLAGYAGCSREAFLRRVKDLSQVRLLSPGDLAAAEGHSLVKQTLLIDPDDVAYVKAFVASGADFLWTRDKSLIQLFPSFAVLILPRRGEKA